jgi:hypothetical protein
MGWACRTHGRHEKLIKILAGKAEWKKPLGRPRCRWEDIIRMDVMETGMEAVEYIHLAQDTDQWQASVNMLMNPCVP